MQAGQSPLARIDGVIVRIASAKLTVTEKQIKLARGFKAIATPNRKSVTAEVGNEGANRLGRSENSP